LKKGESALKSRGGEFGLMPEYQARLEANRCLSCFDSPCTSGCPANIDVWGFIQRIRSDDFQGAADLIRSRNIMGTICAFVCPTEMFCSRECPRGKLDRPLEIGKLQRFACDKAGLRPAVLNAVSRGTSGRRIAVVGGGPAGISCAHRLCNLGHSVTIYEKATSLGGLPSYAIPEFRLPREVLKSEIATLLSDMPEVEIKYGMEVGKDVSVASILENYDFVFVSPGLGTERTLKIKGIESAGVYTAIDLLKRISEESLGEDHIGNVAVVVGGGNTALDVATTLKERFQKIVRVIYRRTKKEMPGWEAEFKTAVEHGVEFLWETVPTEIVCENRKLDGKRGVLAPTASSEFFVQADSVVQAIGQEPNFQFCKELPKVSFEGNRIAIKDETGETDNTRIFAGGDVIKGSGTVVQAVAQGRRSADAIDRNLRGTSHC
jgi:dihydropyrimidine dehydrogenase (NAD+) subunit PreT